MNWHHPNLHPAPSHGRENMLMSVPSGSPPVPAGACTAPTAQDDWKRVRGVDECRGSMLRRGFRLVRGSEEERGLGSSWLK